MNAAISINTNNGLTQDELAALEAAHQHVVTYRQSGPDRPIPPRVSLDEAVSLFRQPLPEQGQPADQVIHQLAIDAEPGLNNMTSGGFYGYVIGASYPVGVAADNMVSAWGQNAGSSFETPAISGMERAVGDWVLDLLNLPKESGVGIVTGATVANTQGILAARHVLLANQGWDVEEKGLFGAPAFPILVGAAAHSAPIAGLRYAGLGAGTAVRVATDDQGRMCPDALKKALDACEQPPLVVMQAGQINTGAFDPFAELIPLVHARGGWVHIDGAFGLWLAAVPELAERLEGVHQADSWAVDLHKWLNAPFDVGLAIVRDRSALVAAMSAWGAYLPQTSDQWEPSESTIELSRRARGVPSYAIFKYLGRSGVRELIARHCRLAQKLAELLTAEPGISVLNQIASNQVAITCGEGETGDAQTEAVLGLVQKRGKAYPTHGEWQGRKIIRCSVISYLTTDAHIDELSDEIIAAWRKVSQ